MNDEDKVKQVKEIIKWWENQMCPKCGSEVHIDGSYGCGQWYGKSEREAFSHCEKCDFKHYMATFSDRSTPDEAFLEGIKKGGRKCRVNVKTLRKICQN